MEGGGQGRDQGRVLGVHRGNLDRHASAQSPETNGRARGSIMSGPMASRTEMASLVDLLCCRAAAEPDAALFAFLPDGEDGAAVTFTRGDLDRRARAIAVRLLDLGLENGRALLLYPPGLDFI